MRQRVVRLLLLVSLVPPLSAWAQAPAGAEFRVNTTTLLTQSESAVAADAAGNFVVVWESASQDGDGLGVFGQRFNAQGFPQGSEFQVNAFSAADQARPSVVFPAPGNFVVVWQSRDQDGSSYGVFGQRFNALGGAQGPEFRVNTSTAGSQRNPSVAAAPAGGFVVVWESEAAPSNSEIFAQRYDASGTPLGSEFQVNTFTTNDQRYPSVSSDASGNFVVGWQSAGQDGSDYGIFGQRFDAQGVGQGTEFVANTFTTGAQRFPSLASDQSGNFFVVWDSEAQDGSGRGIFAQRFAATGIPQGLEFRIRTYLPGDQSRPSVATDRSGTFLVTWEGVGGADDSGVFGRLYDGSGLAVGSRFPINTHTLDTQAGVSVAATSHGGFVATWHSDLQDGSEWGVYGQGFADLIFMDGFEPGNAAPVAVDDAFGTDEDSALAGSSVLANDTDAENDALTAALVSDVSSGALIFNADGTFAYTPAPDFNGTDSFTYRAHDGNQESNVATVTLTVNAVNDAPAFTRGPDQAVAENSGPQTVSPWATGISAGPPDESGQTLAFSVTGNTNPGLFAAGPAVSATGDLTYTPATNAFGAATITLVLTDDGGTASGGVDTSPPQSFIITVNQAPAITSADNTTFTVDGTAKSFTVTTTGLPAPGLGHTGTLPASISFTDNGNGTATIGGTPTATDVGSYPITITANNGVPPNATQNFNLSITCAAITVTNPGASVFPVGQAIPGSPTFTQSGGAAGGTFSVATGALPSGVSLSTTGVLSGTPTETGSFPITVTYTAPGGCSGTSVTYTLQIDCPTITVNPASLTDALFGQAYGPVNFSQTGSTGTTFNWTSSTLPGAGLTFSTGGVLSSAGTSNTGVQNVTFTVTDNFSCTGARTINNFAVRPVADADTYNNGVGNTQFVVGAAAPLTPHVLVSDNILTGDQGPGPLSASLSTGPSQGAVVVNAAGTFTYTPNAGFAGPSDSFTYTLTDGNAVTNTGTVTINLSDVVWYVNSSGVNGDGRSHLPFNTLANAATPSSAGSYIYVHSGGATTTGNLTMDASQTLWGQGAAFTLNGLTIASGATPTLTGTVTLANSTLVNSVSFTPAGIPALTGSALTLPVAINQVSVTGGTNALSLTNVSGTVTVTNATFSNGSGAEVLINQGTGTVNLGATITNNSGRSIDIQNRTGGAVTFTGSITDTGAGILLNNNTGSTITFAGGLSLSTGANAAFTATGGGTVTATQDNGSIVNTLTTAAGTALNVANTTIGVGGLTFRSISSNGAPSGIVLNATGSSGGLTVTGNGGAGTGGTISNSTADSISLTSTMSPNFSWLNITDTTGGAADEAIEMDNITGTVSITGCTVTGPHNDLHLDNNNTNLTAFNLTNSTFTNTKASAVGANGVLVVMRGTSTLTSALIKGCTFSNNFSTGLQVAAQDTATISNFAVGQAGAGNGNTFTGNNAGMDMNQSQASNITFTIENNVLTSHTSQSINAFAATGSTGGTMTGSIKGNTVGTAGVADSGSNGTGSGIRIVSKGGCIGSFNIDNNQIREVPNGRGVEVSVLRTASGNGGAKVKVTSNTVSRPTGSSQAVCGPVGPCPLASIWVASDNETSSGDEIVCAQISGNTAYDPTSWPNGGEAAYYLQGNTFTGPALLDLQGTEATPAAQITTTNSITDSSLAPVIIDGNVQMVGVSACGTFPP